MHFQFLADRNVKILKKSNNMHFSVSFIVIILCVVLFNIFSEKSLKFLFINELVEILEIVKNIVVSNV